MQLVAAAPEWNDEIGFDQYAKMFGDALASHNEMAAKLIESLSVGSVELIQQGAPTRIGESFKDIIHCRNICNQMVAYGRDYASFPREIGP